jgi:tetratricopeptide (TPR) repeat protein
LAVNGLLFRVSKDTPLTAPHGLWSRFRVPSVGIDGNYLSRETAARFFIFRGANGLRSGMSHDMVLADFRKAAEIGFDNTRLVNNIGMEFMKAGWMDNAAQCFHHTLDIDPKFIQGWFNMAVLTNERGRPVEAEENYRHCLALDPRYTPARDGLAVILFHTGRLEEAVEQWEELIKRDMSYPPAFRNLGLAILQVDPTHARMLLEQYLKMSPDAPDRVVVIKSMNSGT